VDGFEGLMQFSSIKWTGTLNDLSTRIESLFRSYRSRSRPRYSLFSLTHIRLGDSMARTWLRKVYDRDQGICAICKQPVDWNFNGTYEDGAPQIDHFIPRDHGGEDRPENYRLSHGGCNRSRGTEEVTADSDYTVPFFKCAQCGGDIPYSHLGRVGNQPVVCSRECRRLRRNQKQLERASMKRIPSPVPSTTGVVPHPEF
jgi:HNH endonuclease